MEADGLRWALLIIGSVVIVGLAVHGIWLSRKNSEKKANANKPKNDQQYQPSDWQPDAEQCDEEVNDSTVDFGSDIGDKETEPHFDIPVATHSDYDDLGLGAVRVVSSEPKIDTEAEVEPTTVPHIEEEPDVPQRKIYASVVTQPKPEYVAEHASLAAQTVAISQQERAQSKDRNETRHETIREKTSENINAATQTLPVQTTSDLPANEDHQAPDPPPFLLKKNVATTEPVVESPVVTESPDKTKSADLPEQKKAEEKPHATLVEKLSLSEQARKLVKRKKAEAAKVRREPKMAEDQLRIDFDEEPSVEPAPKKALKSKPAEPEQEVLVLNVKSADNNPIPGSALLPMLLTLGFKFGDQDIFHRHVNANGKGPVLFSLANMFKPGDFDIDNLENFTTQGISLFMILPIEGDPHQVFNMMHNAARKIADEFSAQIHDAKRTLLTKQSLQQYVEKIREFERQRLLQG